MSAKTFNYRVLLVDDERSIREVGKAVLESQGYEVIVAEDGFDALAALKHSLPDIIISDLRMPNMNGFEFLSVVRQRFSHIPVIAVSGEFMGLEIPESVLADAFFAKGQYGLDELFAKIASLLQEMPPRPRKGKSAKAAVWVRADNNLIVVTCTNCLRTFPVTPAAVLSVQTANCDFCSNAVRFQLTEEAAKAIAN